MSVVQLNTTHKRIIDTYLNKEAFNFLLGAGAVLHGPEVAELYNQTLPARLCGSFRYRGESALAKFNRELTTLTKQNNLTLELEEGGFTVTEPTKMPIHIKVVEDRTATRNYTANALDKLANKDNPWVNLRACFFMTEEGAGPYFWLNAETSAPYNRGLLILDRYTELNWKLVHSYARFVSRGYTTDINQFMQIVGRYVAPHLTAHRMFSNSLIEALKAELGDNFRDSHYNEIDFVALTLRNVFLRDNEACPPTVDSPHPFGRQGNAPEWYRQWERQREQAARRGLTPERRWGVVRPAGWVRGNEARESFTNLRNAYGATLRSAGAERDLPRDVEVTRDETSGTFTWAYADALVEDIPL